MDIRQGQALFIRLKQNHLFIFELQTDWQKRQTDRKTERQNTVIFIVKLVWYGMVLIQSWFGLVWFGLVGYGLVWFIWRFCESFSKIWLVLATLELLWYGLVWFGLVWDTIHPKILWKCYQDPTCLGCFRESLELVWYGFDQ